VAGVAATIGLLSIYPEDASLLSAAVPSWATTRSTIQLSAAADAVRTEVHPGFSWNAHQWSVTRARVIVSGIEPYWSVDLGPLRAVLDIGGHRLSSVAPLRPAAPLTDGDEPFDRATTRRLLEVTELQPERSRQAATALLVVPKSEFDRVAPARGSYRADIQVVLKRHEIEASLPLRAGVGYRVAGYAMRISHIAIKPDDVSVIILESNASPALQASWQWKVEYFLRNRGRHQALEGFLEPFGDSFLLTALLPNFSVSSAGSARGSAGFNITSTSLRFSTDSAKEHATFSIDQEWLAGADLVVATTTPVGAIERRLQIADFPLRQDPSPAATTDRR
jgi:hypothetical protein